MKTCSVTDWLYHVGQKVLESTRLWTKLFFFFSVLFSFWRIILHSQTKKHRDQIAHLAPATILTLLRKKKDTEFKDGIMNNIGEEGGRGGRGGKGYPVTGLRTTTPSAFTVILTRSILRSMVTGEFSRTRKIWNTNRLINFGGEEKGGAAGSEEGGGGRGVVCLFCS